MTRAELIKALESLEGPSREMDAEIALCVGYRSRGSKTRVGINNEVWAAPGEHFSYGTQPPHYTSSIDSALTLVPPGFYRVSGNTWTGDTVGTYQAKIWNIVTRVFEGVHKLEPVALCIAALKAQESTQ